MVPAFEPISPQFELGLGLFALLAAALIYRGRLDRKRNRPVLYVLGQRQTTRIAVAALMLLGLALLVGGPANPIMVRDQGQTTFHLEVVLDVSASVTRSESDLKAFCRAASRRVAQYVDRMPAHLRDGSAGIVTFRGSAASAARNLSPQRLPDVLAALDTTQIAAGSGTNLAAGLEAGAKAIGRAGGSGAIVLLTDGNQTDGDGLAVAKKLGAQGIAVHVLTIEGSLPELAIQAADLPQQVKSGTETFVRGGLANNSPTEAATHLTLARNPHISEQKNRVGQATRVESQYQMPPGARAAFRWPVYFEGHGLQYVDLTLGKPGETLHQRRFFTQVKRPPRLLSVGGDHRWAEAFAPEIAEIEYIEPQLMGNDVAIRDFDVVVLSGVPAPEFAPGALDDLAAAITDDGLGLLLINGSHGGAGEQDETVLMSFNDTAIEDLLPVSSRPKPKDWEPPSRHVVILIDTSGSMSGSRMDLAREIATHIVGNLLRPKDYLDLITFAGDARHLLEATPMDGAGKNRAIDILQTLSSGGGTDPSNALELLGRRRMEQCGLIFISDGMFQNLDYRPDCRATVFAIGTSKVPENSPLRALADPFPVPAGFDPGNISIPYFEPEKRTVFWEKGSFRALSLNAILPRSQQLPIPDLPLRGNAVTTLIDDAVLNGVRPKLTDPILAFRQAGLGRTGVFTSGLSRQWLSHKDGKAAISAWVDYLSPMQHRDRYDFRIRTSGNNLNLTVSLLSDSGPPAVDQLEGRLMFAADPPRDVLFRADPTQPATFTANIRLDRDVAATAMLSLAETGLEALAREQRLPIVLPPPAPLFRQNVREGLTYGVNEPLLQHIAETTGGVYAPQPGDALFRKRLLTSEKQQKWPFLVLPGLMCYLAAIALQRWDP